MNYANSNQPASPRPSGVLESALQNLSSGVAELASCIDALESSMFNVLQPRMPEPPAPTPTTAVASLVPATPSPMVEQAQTLRSHIDALIAQVNTLGNRVQA